MKNDFARLDSNPGALVNTNNDALGAYKKAKDKMRRVDQLELRLDKMEQILGKIYDHIITDDLV